MCNARSLNFDVVLPDDDCSWWSDIWSLIVLLDLFFSVVQWHDEHDGYCCLRDVRWCFIRVDFRWSSATTASCGWGCWTGCCLGITWICTSARRSSSKSVFIWLDKSSRDLKRSLSSVNKPEIVVEDVVDAFDEFVLFNSVADEDDADEDDVDAWVLGAVLVCCDWAECWDEGKGGGGGGGNIDDAWWWWWWWAGCGWRIRSPVTVSFSSTNTTRT